MQSMTFHPVVADIGDQMVNIGLDSLAAGSKASMSVTSLIPAGADEVSLQAVTAFHADAAELLALHQAAQEELMRTGQALTQIAQTYAEVDEAAANTLVFGFNPLPYH
ncbi:hypothetical protein AWC27_27980 [Mycobacterium szulgai]|uniref:PE domain-containing protein n=2 Tax=Mycobacterium szulgai TaxID=1787 RepID=A0A1X2EJ80_MYCSZ|nr:PE family protein [Mycobacterium szulgai]ORX03577.1 hypothetical protein AWC27_27980 [Mycobacterium szulgai]